MMTKILPLLLGVWFWPSLVTADCPDFYFKCPTGESFIVNTCWSWSAWNCQTCRTIQDEMKLRCRQFSCGGSVENWYARNDGCSAPGISGTMTQVFGAACAIHDMCYATPGMTKLECDGGFYHNMMETCSFTGIGLLGLPICHSTASTAFLAVYNHGDIFPGFASTCVEV